MNKNIENTIKERFNQDERGEKAREMMENMKLYSFHPVKNFQVVYYKNKKQRVVKRLFLLAKIFKVKKVFKTKDNCNNYYKDYNTFMCNSFGLITDILDETIPLCWEENSFFANMVDVRNIEIGDKNDFQCTKNECEN